MKNAAFRICRRFDHRLSFGGLSSSSSFSAASFHVLSDPLQSPRPTVPDTALPQRESASERAFQIGVRLNVRSIHKHDLRRKISRAGDFLQHPPEHPFDHFRSKAVAKRIADRRKMRKRL